MLISDTLGLENEIKLLILNTFELKNEIEVLELKIKQTQKTIMDPAYSIVMKGRTRESQIQIPISVI